MLCFGTYNLDMLKANLHFHTAEDDAHDIAYDLYAGIDHARGKGFDVLAVTCHRKFVCTSDHVAYAAERDILLLPGIEADIYEGKKRNHVLIINATRDVEELRTFEDLAHYRKEHEEVLVIAPHPYHVGGFSLHDLLEQYIDLFDAIEHSWFYSTHFDRNKKAQAVAARHGRSYIATSDTHFLDFMDESYALIDAEKETKSVIGAVRKGSFTNVTSPRSLLKDMLWRTGTFMARDALLKKWRK
jgi:predicted metal-dependent phosphoesterase TrpH